MCEGGDSSASALIAPASTEPDAVWMRKPLSRRGGVAATGDGDESAAVSTDTTGLVSSALADDAAAAATAVSLCAAALAAAAAAVASTAATGDAGRVARTTRTACSRGVLRARGGGGEAAALAASSVSGAASGGATVTVACIAPANGGIIANTTRESRVSSGCWDALTGAVEGGRREHAGRREQWCVQRSQARGTSRSAQESPNRASMLPAGGAKTTNLRIGALCAAGSQEKRRRAIIVDAAGIHAVAASVLVDYAAALAE